MILNLVIAVMACFGRHLGVIRALRSTMTASCPVILTLIVASLSPSEKASTYLYMEGVGCMHSVQMMAIREGKHALVAGSHDAIARAVAGREVGRREGEGERGTLAHLYMEGAGCMHLVH